jgi:molybdopterin synthase sulfur carrier subunit
MKVLAFGIVKDIFGNSAIDVDLKHDATIGELKSLLDGTFPRLNELGSYMIAVNNEYASINDKIYQRDEVAVIPPVSGG